MTEPSKKDALARFEHINEAMPQLTTESQRSAAEAVRPEAGQSDVRSIRVSKLDRHTVWRVIELLKSL